MVSRLHLKSLFIHARRTTADPCTMRQWTNGTIERSIDGKQNTALSLLLLLLHLFYLQYPQTHSHAHAHVIYEIQLTHKFKCGLIIIIESLFSNVIKQQGHLWQIWGFQNHYTRSNSVNYNKNYNELSKLQIHMSKILAVPSTELFRHPLKAENSSL